MSRAIREGRRMRWALAMVLALSAAPLGCGGGTGGGTSTGGQAITPPEQIESNEAQDAFMKSQGAR